jgi:hypothetical protein
MCSLRFQNNLLTIESLRFDIEENTIIEAFVRFRFASVAITTFDTQCASAKWRLSYCEIEQSPYL